MDRDLAVKLVDTLADIKDDFDDVVTALDTIATNTTPADNSRGGGEAKSGKEQEEQEEPEETRGGKK